MKKTILKLVFIAAIALGVGINTNVSKDISEPPPGGWRLDPGTTDPTDPTTEPTA